MIRISLRHVPPFAAALYADELGVFFAPEPAREHARAREHAAVASSSSPAPSARSAPSDRGQRGGRS